MLRIYRFLGLLDYLLVRVNKVDPCKGFGSDYINVCYTTLTY